jgi:imidazolonepropionase-like amidohydrolase
MKILHLAEDCDILCGAVWDGQSLTLTDTSAIHIRKNRIDGCVRTGTSFAQLDMNGFTLMPALIDCHVHLALPYHDDVPIGNRTRSLLHSGVIGIREGGARSVLPAHSPLYVSHCHVALSKFGYYGSNLGSAVRNTAEALKKIDTLADTGAGHIKIIASGIFSFTDFGETGPIPFSRDELCLMTRQAHKHGLPVMAHASGDEAVQNCIYASVDSIEHGYFMKETTLALLTREEIAWVPTLAPVAAQLETPDLYHALTSEQKIVVHRSLQRHQDLVGLGGALCTRIGAGTAAGAAGVPHGPALAREVSLLFGSGLSAVAALKAATSVAAEICRFSALGQIAPGKKPALLAVRGNPLHNPGIIAHPQFLLMPL